MQPALGGASQAQPPGALLAVEVDSFELIDRAHGPQLADVVIRQVLGVLQGVVGGGEFVARRQGGEFTAFLPGATATIARGRAEEVAAEVRRSPVALPGGRQLPLTLSIGVALAPEHGTSQGALLAPALRARGRVAAAGGDGVAFAPPPAEEPATPPLQLKGFIGRSDQLRTLVRVLDETMRGRARLAVVHAEQGVGTGTLVRALVREARVRGGATVVARAFPADLRPAYGVWRQVVEKLLQATRVPRGDWTELPNLVPGAGSRFPMDLVGTRGDGSGSQYRLLEELTECIATVARSKPLLVVIEGMQWADAASWDALEHLLTQLGDAPVLLAITMADDRFSPETKERRHALLERAGVLDVPVPRLTRDEVKRWLERAFHGQDVGREFLSFVYGLTRGNVLFIHQLLRALLEEGAIWHSGERWEWRPASELRFPSGVAALLERRMERLQGRAQLALATAAVIGRSFDASLLAAVMGGGEAATKQVIAEGLAAGLLDLEEPGGSRVRFAHQLMADVLLQHLPPRRRQRIHRDIALTLAAFGTAENSEIAAHFDRGGTPREAYLRGLAAADRAERLYAFTTASEALQLAARNSSTPEELAQARARMASLAERLGRFDEAEELCDLAIEWFAGQEEHEQTVSLRLLRERARDQLGQPARRTLDALAQLDREAAALGLRGERVAILIALSLAWARLGDPSAAEKIAAEAVWMAEQLGDARLLSTALNRHAVSLEPGREEEAKAILRRAIALFQQVGDSKGQARAYNNLGVMYQRQGDLAGVVEALRMAIAVARTAKMPDIWGTAALNLGVFKLKEGSYDEARAFFEQALSLFTAVKTAELQLYALCNLAEVERATGHYREAAEMFEMAASLAQRIGAADAELAAIGGAGISKFADGRLSEATEALRRVGPRTISRGGWFQGRELIEALAIMVALEEGRPDQAVKQFSLALQLAAGGDIYGGAFLTAFCAQALTPIAPDLVEQAVTEYAPRAAASGYVELTRSLRELTGAPSRRIS